MVVILNLGLYPNPQLVAEKKSKESLNIYGFIFENGGTIYQEQIGFIKVTTIWNDGWILNLKKMVDGLMEEYLYL